MPSPRRLKLLLFTTILATLVLFYVSSGARQTQHSPFYRKTVQRIDTERDIAAAAKAAAAATEREQIAASLEAGRPSLDDNGNPQDNSNQEAIMWQSDERLRERLRDAEAAAKKSADDKYNRFAQHGEVRPAAKDEYAAAQPAQDMKKEQLEQPLLAVPPEPAVLPPPPPGSNGRKVPLVMPGNAPAADGVAKVGNVGNQPAKAATTAASTASTTASSTTTTAAAAAAVEKDPTNAIEVELSQILARAPVVIFSKSYCPHSAKAKRILLEAHAVTPAPHVVELDQHELGTELQALLAERTGRKTVPNVMVAGQSLGGGSEIEALWKDGRVKSVLEGMSGGRTVAVRVVQEWEDPEAEDARGLR